jgi:hypothetical protein
VALTMEGATRWQWRLNKILGGWGYLQQRGADTGVSQRGSLAGPCSGKRVSRAEEKQWGHRRLLYPSREGKREGADSARRMKRRRGGPRRASVGLKGTAPA